MRDNPNILFRTSDNRILINNEYQVLIEIGYTLPLPKNILFSIQGSHHRLSLLYLKLSRHTGYNGVISVYGVLCTPLQIKCYQEFIVSVCHGHKEKLDCKGQSEFRYLVRDKYSTLLSIPLHVYTVCIICMAIPTTADKEDC